MLNGTSMNLDFKKREPIIFLCCFAGAYLFVIAGIIQQQSPASGLLTQVPGALLVAFVIYGAVLILRIIYLVIARLWFRK